MPPAPARRVLGPRRARRAAGAALLLALGAGCASVGRLVDGYHDAYRAAPVAEGGHEWLRAALEANTFDAALGRLTTERDAPRDELLRALYAGLVAHYGGHYARSAQSFAAAGALADDRYTKSVTRHGVALLSSDLVLPYTSGRTERLLVHYYGVVGYLRQDSAAAAAVEARRLSKLLQEYADDRAPEERSTHAVLHYVAGAAFEAAGERTSAAVAYRNAAALGGDSVPRAAARDLPARPPTRGAGQRAARQAAAARVPTGDVVVVLEQGFVGHRVETSATIGLDSSEVVQLASGRSDTSFAALIVRRLAEPAARPEPGAAEIASAPRTFPRGDEAGGLPGAVLAAARGTKGDRRPRAADDGPQDATPAAPGAAPAVIAAARRPGYVLRLAWPTFVHPGLPPAPLGVVIAGDAAHPAAVRLRASVSDAAQRDYERQRPWLLTRSAARAAVKTWATRAARKKGGTFGGAMANAATALLERADTRSWHLLPGAISVARLTLPVGTHQAVVTLPAAGGVRRVVLGDVTVREGRVSVLSARLWNNAGKLVPVAAAAVPTAASPTP